MKTTPLPQGDAFRLAAQGSGTPIALASFINLRRRRHKGHGGVDAAETPIESSLYTHAILQRDGTVESDVPQSNTRNWKPWTAVIGSKTPQSGVGNLNGMSKPYAPSFKPRS